MKGVMRVKETELSSNEGYAGAVTGGLDVSKL